MFDTRESLAKELAEERLSNAQEEALQGGLGMDYFKALTVDAFMADALDFVDRCIAIGAN